MVRVGLLAFLLAFSCSEKQKEARDIEADSTLLKDTSAMVPHDIFAFKNLKNTTEVDASNIKLNYLDSSQMRRIVANCPGLRHRAFWIMHDWRVAYIAKQDPIGNYTPIIVSVGGTDYAALILILLNSKGSPVSHFILRGGECDGSALCDTSNSTINSDKIDTYRVKYVSNPDEDMFITVDSVIYSSKILQNGTIETKKQDSIRYKRKFL